MEEEIIKKLKSKFLDCITSYKEDIIIKELENLYKKRWNHLIKIINLISLLMIIMILNLVANNDNNNNEIGLVYNINNNYNNNEFYEDEFELYGKGIEKIKINKEKKILSLNDKIFEIRFDYLIIK